VRYSSFGDRRIGKSENVFFKPSLPREKPHRLACIPAVAYDGQLTPTPDLQRRAKAGDATAVETLGDMVALRQIVTNELKKRPPAAEVWADPSGKKGILYAHTEFAKVVWVPDVGYVRWDDSIPSGFGDKIPYAIYGMVIIEYDLGGTDNEPIILPPDQQIELGGGHKLNFSYELKMWSLNDGKTRAWKEHTGTNPLIANDFLVWTQREGAFDKTKFSPAGPALWRQDPVVMAKIIREASGLHSQLGRTLAKEFSADELRQLLSGGGRAQLTATATLMPPVEEVDFAALLGNGAAMPEEAPADSPEIPPTSVESNPLKSDPVLAVLEEGIQQAEINNAAEAHRKALEARSL
jgi:hypothetical protein